MSVPTLAGSAATTAAASAPAVAGGQVVVTAAQTAAVLSLVNAQAAARARLLANATVYLLRLLSGFRGWYDEAAVASFASTADGQVRRLQQASADLTTSYQVQMLARLGVGLSRAEQARARFVVPGEAEPGLRGVDFLAEFERPAKVYRFEREQGADAAMALERASQRLRDLAAADEALAMRRASQRALTVAGGLNPDDVLNDAGDLADPETLDGRSRDGGDLVGRQRSKARVVGSRRILHPELSAGGPCGLCVVASDRLYTVTELLDIHGGCVCTVAAVVEVDGKILDPGQKINAADLERIYQAAGGTDAASLKRTRIQVDEHGELGPVLAPATRRDSNPAKPRLQRGAKPGESALDEARRRLTYLENEVAYVRKAVDGGQSKYAPTLALRERALAQHRVRVTRLEKAAARAA